MVFIGGETQKVNLQLFEPFVKHSWRAGVEGKRYRADDVVGK